MKVLSTTTTAWRACARALTAWMSTSLSSGLVGDSSQTSRVRSVTAFSTAFRSEPSTKEKLRPIGSRTRRNRR